MPESRNAEGYFKVKTGVNNVENIAEGKKRALDREWRVIMDEYKNKMCEQGSLLQGYPSTSLKICLAPRQKPYRQSNL